jgi:hypothetical protein
MIVPRRLLTAFVLIAAASSASAEDLGPQVAKFAQEQLGKKVGDGQCSTLAAAAVKAAGGRHVSTLGPTGKDANFVWGRRIVTLTPKSDSAKDVKPGDIIQFRDVAFTKKEKTTAEDGSWKTWNSDLSLPHHTAIVRAVKDNFLEVLHQNYGPEGTSEDAKKVVQAATIWVGSPRTSRQSGTATTETQYSFTKGTIWVYRPFR